MKRGTLFALILTAMLAVTGCSTAPNQADVADRIRIEYAGITGLNTSGATFDKLATSTAADLENGECGRPAYFTGLASAAEFRDAVLIVCLTDFEDQMPKSLHDEAMTVVLREASSPES